MKKYIILITVILNFNSAFSSYIATYLPTLIETSNVIVYGKIISVNTSSFKIQVIEKIKALATNQDTLVVEKFNNWACASRYLNYEIGQEAIYFLKRSKDKKLRVIGAGNEGEIFSKLDTAYVRDYEQTQFKSQHYSFLSKYEKFIAIRLKEVIQGIKTYLQNKEAIAKELEAERDNTSVYKYKSIDKLPKNYFLSIILDQKARL